MQSGAIKFIIIFHPFLIGYRRSSSRGFWIRRVGVQNVLEDDKLDVGFWNIWLIQISAGFCPKAKMVPPENVNQIVIEAFQLPLINAYIGKLSFRFHGRPTKSLQGFINSLSTIR
jgi:hypothetical protein